MPESETNLSNLTVEPTLSATSRAAGSRDASHPAPSQGRGAVRILVFFLIFAVLVFLMDRAVNSGLRRITTSGFGVMNKIVDGQINADILITGSSRAFVHYDPRAITSATGLSAYNIGLNGTQSDIQLAVLKTYLQQNKKPKLVIHNLDLYSFQTSKEIYEVARYFPYLDEAPIYETVHSVYPDAWRWKLFPLYGHLVEDMRFNWLKGLKSFVGIQPREDLIQGFIPRHLSWTGDFEKFREQNPDGVHFEMTDAGIRCIEELVETCQNAGVPLLFVYSPEYRPMQEMERNREEIFATFRDISERFDVPLWDYSSSPICLSQENFYNSQHLNAGGSSKFSRDLAGRLQQRFASGRNGE